MKNKFLIMFILMAMPLFAGADEPKNPTNDLHVEATVATEVPTEAYATSSSEEDLKMECVWTSCRGTECSTELVDEEYRAVYIDAYDRC